MRDYMINRSQLANIFLLIDGSISPQKIDLDYINELHHHDVPFTIIITKTDKCNQKELHKNMNLLKKYIQETIGSMPETIETSSNKKK